MKEALGRRGRGCSPAPLLCFLVTAIIAILVADRSEVKVLIGEDEEQLAVGGGLYRRAGCLLVPFLPVKAAGMILVTTKRVIFDPILHYKLVTRKFDINLSDVAGAQASGSDMELDILNLINIGKALTIRLKSGKKYVFRSTEAEQLAEGINQALRRGPSQE